MSAVALTGASGSGRGDLARWGASFAAILGLHAAAVGFLLASRSPVVEPGEALPAVMVDMAPPSSAPTLAPSPTPPSENVPEMTALEPVVDAPADIPVPEVTLPEPQPVATAEIPPPDPVPQTPLLEPVKPPPVVPETAAVALPPPPKAAPKPKVKPPEKVVDRRPPKPVQAKRGERQETRQPPAQESGGQMVAAVASTSAGSTAASRASWQGALVAHLRRNLQPQGGQTGSASVRFTMTRSGGVISTALVGSAGNPALDQEALAVFRRSQPLPAAPAEVPGNTFTFTIPVRFTSR